MERNVTLVMEEKVCLFCGVDAVSVEQTRRWELSVNEARQLSLSAR